MLKQLSSNSFGLNSTGHLLHKTNTELHCFCYFEIVQDIYYIKQTPDLSYLELSYVFWEHNDSVGRGTTVHGQGIRVILVPMTSTYCTALIYVVVEGVS